MFESRTKEAKKEERVWKRPSSPLLFVPISRRRDKGPNSTILLEDQRRVQLLLQLPPQLPFLSGPAAGRKLAEGNLRGTATERPTSALVALLFLPSFLPPYISQAQRKG